MKLILNNEDERKKKEQEQGPAVNTQPASRGNTDYAFERYVPGEQRPEGLAIVPLQNATPVPAGTPKMVNAGNNANNGMSFQTYTGDYVSPFGQADLDLRYQQTVYALKDFSPDDTTTLRDSFQIVDGFKNLIVDSVNYGVGTDADRTATAKAADDYFYKEMEKAQMKYFTQGKTYDELQAEWNRRGYKDQWTLDAEDEARYQQWKQQNGPRVEPQQMDDPFAGEAQHYSDLLETITRVNNGQEAPEELQKEIDYIAKSRFGGDSTAAADWIRQQVEQNRVLSAQTQQENARRMEANGSGQMLEDYDARNGWMEWARQNRNKRGEALQFWQDPLEARRIMQETNINDLTDVQRELWQQMVNELPEETAYRLQAGMDLTDEDRRNIAAYSQRQTQYLQGTQEIFPDREETPYGQQLLQDAMRNTPEGAAYWAQHAAGTDEEQIARDNLYFVENREKYNALEQNEDFAQKSQYDPNLPYTVHYAEINGQPVKFDPNRTVTSGAVLEQSKTTSGMTEEEKQKYNYLYATEGIKAAEEYLDYLQYALNERKAQSFSEDMRELGSSGWGGGIAASVLSVGMNLTRGLGYLETALQGLDRSKPIDRNSAFNMLAQMGDAGREGVMNQVDWQTNILGRDMDLFDFLYGTTMSGVDSLAAGMTGGELGGALLLGAGAAQSTMQEIYDRNGTDRQALVGGLVSGIFESLFEKVSLGAFFDEAGKLGKKEFKEWMKTIGKETFVNFSEEFNTEVANILYDTLVNGDISEYQRRIDELQGLGMMPEEASAKVFWEKFGQALEAGAGGAVMGAGFGTIGNISSTSATNKANKATGTAILNEKMGSVLKDVGMTLPEGSQARKMAEGYNAGKATAKQTGEMYREIWNAVKNSPKMQDILNRNMSDGLHFVLENGGMGAISADAADGLTAMLEGREMTEEQSQAIAGSETAMQMMQELFLGEEAAEEANAKRTQEEQKQQPMTPAERKNLETAHEEGAYRADTAAGETAEQQEEQGSPAPQTQPMTPEERKNLEAAHEEGAYRDGTREQEEALQRAQQEMQEKSDAYDAAAKETQDARQRGEDPETIAALEKKEADALLEYKDAYEQKKRLEQKPQEMTPAERKNREAAHEEGAYRTQAQGAGQQDTAPAEQKQMPGQKRRAITRGKVQGKDASVVSVERDADGLLTAKTDDGRTVPLDEVETDEPRKIIMQYGAKMDADGAADMQDNYQEGQDAYAFAEGYKRIYDRARKFGETLEQIHSIFGKIALTPEQQQAAWEAGRRAAERETARRMETTQRIAKKSGFEAYNPETKQKGVVLEDVTRDLTESARGQLTIINEWLKRRGSELQVRVHDSITNRQGESIANGKYETGTNVIHIALDADDSALTRTASHEIFHYLKSWNQEAAQQIQKEVLSLLKKTKGYDLEQRIRDMQRDYQRNGQKLTRDAALEEITADSMLDVIGNEENMRQIMKNADQGTIAKIKEWLQNAVAELQNILKSFARDSQEAKALLPQMEAMQKIQKQFEAAETQASENYRQAQEGATRSAQENSYVQEYMRDMQSGEDAQTAMNGLVSQLFFQTQQEWLQQNMNADMDEALQRFADALKKYRTENTALSTVLEAAGFAAPGNGDMNTALSYAADQLLALEERTGEEAGVQYLIKRGLTKGGREVSYVKADRQVIHGTDPNAWGGQIEQYINEQIRKGKDVIVYSPNGVPLSLTKETAGKGGYWNTDQNGNKVSVNDYALKLRMESHIDELAQVSIGKGKQANDHKSHDIARNGFNYRLAYFQDFDGKYYECKISVGKTGHKNTVYNVNQIKEETGAPDELKGSLSLKRRPVALASSEDSIAEYAGDVKEQFSMKRGTDTETDVAQNVEDDAELFAQVTGDKDAYDALGLMHKLDESTGELTKGQWDSRRGEVADRILQETGSGYSRLKLIKELATLYQAMDDKAVDFGEKVQYAREIMRKVLNEGGAAAETDESVNEVKRLIRTRGFYLTDEMKSELRETGQARGFYQKNFGRMALRQKAVNGKGSYLSLSDLWSELNEVLPGAFPADASEADMPIMLDAWLDNNGPKDVSSYYGRDAAAYATDLAYQAMLDYYDVPGALRKTQDIRKEFRQKLQEYRQNFQQKQEEKMKTSRERAALTQEKQKLRSEIGRSVKYMNTRIVGQTDVRHVPEGLRGAAERMVQPFLQDTSVFDKNQLARLRSEYATMAKDGRNHDMAAARAYDADIEEKLERLEKTLDGRKLSECTKAELEDIRDIVGNLKKMITEADAMHVAGRTTRLETEATAMVRQLRSQEKRSDNKWIRKIGDAVYKELTPIYYAKKVGGVIEEGIGDLMEGQNQWAFNAKKAKEYFEEVANRYQLNQWINDKETLRFETTRGEEIELNRDEAMALYATWKREITNTRQNANHLRIGGFMYAKDAEHKGIDTQAPHAITAADMQQVMDFLGKDQMAFADEMVQYLSTTMADLGNETSMAMYGYKKFGETYYFPYSSDRNFLTTELDEEDSPISNKVKNAGMTKQTVRNASNPVVIDSFLKTWANHVNQMCLYNAFAEAQDNLVRLYNYKTAGEVKVDSATGKENVVPPMSMKLEMEKALGPGARNYLRTLILDINGGVANQERTGVGKLLSLFKKGSVAGNFSVVLQQPSAFARSMNMVSPKYMLNARNLAHMGKARENMYKYSGVAIIKEMGRFDTGVGASATEWILDSVDEKKMKDRIRSKLDDWTGWGAEKADELTWTYMWAGIENEIKDKMPELTVGSEEYYQAVAARFNDVMNHTQVYDSVMSKSEMMRSNSTMDKMLTSFMAEPTLTANMLMDAMQNITKPGGKAKAARAAAVFVNAALVNSLLKSIATAFRKGKDEDRTYIEKYLGDVAGNFLEDVGPAGIASMIPLARDIVSLFQGYDVARSDMTAVEQIKTALDKLNNEKVTTEDKLEAVVGAAGYIFGVPTKNLWRDIEGVARTFLNGAPLSETSGRDIKYTVADQLNNYLPIFWDSSRKGYYSRIGQAMAQGQDEAAREMMGYMTETNGVSEKTLSSGVKSEVRDSVTGGRMETDDAISLLEKFFGMDRNKAFFQVDEWLQKKEHEGDEEYSYKQAGKLFDAIDNGGNIREAAKELLDHGVKKENVKITDQYKAKYVELYRTDKAAAANLKARILNAYEALGYDRAKKNKDIEKWLAEKKK